MDLQSQTSGYDTPQNNFTYRERHAHHHDVIERTIVAAGSFLTCLLVFRFILALLGANPANGFANFIYSFTAPFVTPFYNLFSYDHPSLGIASFEGYTLIAIAVYGLVVAGISRLISITRY